MNYNDLTPKEKICYDALSKQFNKCQYIVNHMNDYMKVDKTHILSGALFEAQNEFAKLRELLDSKDGKVLRDKAFRITNPQLYGNG